MAFQAKAPNGQRSIHNLPAAGAANPEIREHVHSVWTDAARKGGVDLNDFDPAAPLSVRLAWATRMGLVIGVILTRYSTKMQGSTADQIRCNAEYAARHGIYCPPEFACVDEAIKGSKAHRPGLMRAREILKTGMAKALVIFKLSRLYRKAHKAVRFIEEEIVEAGLRAISVTQNIDTADTKGWRIKVGIYGAMDEEALTAIADHVREGQVGLFLKGWTTGALAIGYKTVPVPGAPPTRRGLPRMMLVVDEPVGSMIRTHFGLIAAGMRIKDGWMKWRRDGGAVDKRSSTGETGYDAYRRMLTRQDYIGVREFCRKRNQWSSKLDAVQQKQQPPEEVKVFRCEELRIVDDETYWKVQKILRENELGPRTGPGKEFHHLWDLVIGNFKCATCVDKNGKPRRFYMCGAKGRYMRCSNPDCPARAMVHRHEAVTAVCKELSLRLIADNDLIAEIVKCVAVVDVHSNDELQQQLQLAERKVRQMVQRIRDTEELLGSGNDEDRARRRALIHAAQQERSGLELEVVDLKRRMSGERADAEPVTQEQIKTTLRSLVALLDDAASGKLGADAVGKARNMFARLVNDMVVVHAERRSGRSRWIVRGRFNANLLAGLEPIIGSPHQFSSPVLPDALRGSEAEVWLLQPPRVDQIADEVVQLYDVEKLGFRLINQRLEAKYQEPIGSGNVCAAYRRYYEVRGLPLPPRRTNTGRPRRRAS